MEDMGNVNAINSMLAIHEWTNGFVFDDTGGGSLGEDGQPKNELIPGLLRPIKDGYGV